MVSAERRQGLRLSIPTNVTESPLVTLIARALALPRTGFAPLAFHAQVTDENDLAPDIATSTGDKLFKLPDAGLATAGLSLTGAARFPAEDSSVLVRLRPATSLLAAAFGAAARSCRCHAS